MVFVKRSTEINWDESQPYQFFCIPDLYLKLKINSIGFSMYIYIYMETSISMSHL